jgi:hypothetical protein
MNYYTIYKAIDEQTDLDNTFSNDVGLTTEEIDFLNSLLEE